MSQNKKVLHTKLDGCSDKFLAAVNIKLITAKAIHDIAFALQNMPMFDPIAGAILLRRSDIAGCRLMDTIRLMAVCKKCNSVIPLEFMNDYQLLHAAITYLVQNGKISGTCIEVPTIDEIIKSMEKKLLFLKFSVNCNRCGYEYDTYYSNPEKLECVGVPKLTA